MNRGAPGSTHTALERSSTPRRWLRSAQAGQTPQAMQPMRMMVQQVMGGIWIGEGANAFVDEVSSLMIPGVGQVMDQINTTTRNINRAVEVIDEADKKVQSMVGSLNDVFGRIY